MNISHLTLTIAAAGALAACRFVTQFGAYPAAGAAAIGVTRTNAAVVGDLVPVDAIGTGMAEAGAAFAKDVPLMVDDTGRVIAHTGVNKAVGRSMQAATAVGDMVEVFLAVGAGN